MHYERTRLLGGLFLVVVMVAGCGVKVDGSPTSTTSQSPSGSSTEVATPDPTTKAEIETLETDGGALASVPEDVFIADSHTTAEMAEMGGKKNVILMYPESDIESFVSTFHAGMTESGWTLVTSSELPIGTIANFSKDGRKCTVSISPPKDKSIKVAIMLPDEG